MSSQLKYNFSIPKEHALFKHLQATGHRCQALPSSYRHGAAEARTYRQVLGELAYLLLHLVIVTEHPLPHFLQSGPHLQSQDHQ